MNKNKYVLEAGDIVLVKEANPYTNDLVIIERPYKIVGGITLRHAQMELTIDMATRLLEQGEITAVYKKERAIMIGF